MRLIGIGHIFWLPLLPYLAMNLPEAVAQPALYWWLVTLIALDSVSLVIDAVDLARYIRGERAPCYVW